METFISKDDRKLSELFTLALPWLLDDHTVQWSIVYRVPRTVLSRSEVGLVEKYMAWWYTSHPIGRWYYSVPEYLCHFHPHCKDDMQEAVKLMHEFFFFYIWNLARNGR